MLTHQARFAELRTSITIWIGLLALCSVISNGVATADDAITAQGIEFFEKQVRPLLVQHCYECHSASEANGGLLVDSRDGLVQGGDSGTAIVPGKPDASLLIQAIAYDNEDLRMPPESKLDDAAIAVLTKWVSIGAPDPRQRTAAQSTAPTGMTIEAGREFWAFRAVENPSIPRQTRSQNPVDTFVQFQLASKGIVQARPADRETLIRRVYFDLIGLPPTPCEIDDFLNDDSPDAYQRVVDRLLASPDYGVRWGRHWLDVARYADSNGLDENLAFGNAWRYRDYVVDSFNQDKPFDRFLVEQVAGDLLPHANRETRTATGFLVLGAKVLAEQDREKLVMDTIDEQIDAMGKAFLGMTFGCARCHDHKFDPVKQKDYYALAAIFKSTKTFGETKTGAIQHWNEISYASTQHSDEIKQVNKLIAEKKKAASTFKNKLIGQIGQAARERAADYLVAATQFPPTATLTDVAAIANSRDLHPRILHHCRLHLEYNADDSVFADWHRLVESTDSASVQAVVRSHYGELFDSVAASRAEARKENPKANRIEDARLEAARKALNDRSGFLAVPPKPEFAFDESQLAEYYELMEAARVYESGAPDEESVMGVGESTVLASLPIHIRGSHRNLGEPVEREFPQVMWTSMARPVFPSHQSGRLQLARWMASTQHPLTARVYVNRIWRWHFGRGLVSTTENFGALGSRPSHPKLLDWLARTLMQNGWSTKHLHRIILSSQTYQMASVGSRGEANDPENRLLWKFPMQRLDAEQIRDSILAISGRLDSTPNGKTVPLRNRQFVFNHTSVDHTKYDSLRRTIYLPVIRNNLYSFFQQFDFPDPTMPTGNRGATVVAPQALLMMNADWVLDSADAFASKLMSESQDDVQRLRLAYQMTLGRDATAREIQRGQAFLAQAAVQPQRGWAMFCQSLFASNEFIYVR